MVAIGPVTVGGGSERKDHAMVSNKRHLLNYDELLYAEFSLLFGYISNVPNGHTCILLPHVLVVLQ